MSKKKSGVRKNIIVEKKVNKCFSSWIWYVLGALLLLAALFFLYDGMTGNAIAPINFGGIENAVYQIQPVMQFLLGGGYDGQYTFERFLLFLVVLSVVFVVLRTLPLFADEKQRKIAVLLSIIVSILSIRFIDYQWLSTALMSYSVLGVALISFLPFIIYFFFLMKVAPSNPIVRKIGWVLFGCIYLGLYFSAENRFYGSVYIWTALAALAFLLADGTIARAMSKQRLQFGQEMNAIQKISAIDAQIDLISANIRLTDVQRKSAIKNLLDQRRFWEKHLS